MRKLALLLAAIAAVSSTALGEMLTIRLPVRTYLPLRQGNVTISPFFTLGYAPDNMVDMLWYWANPPRIANGVSGNDGWIIRRYTATVTTYKWLYANGKLNAAYQDIYRYHANNGWAIEGWQQNVTSGAWSMIYSSGWTFTPLWDWWNECGFSTEYEDSRVVYPGETGLSGRIDKATTTTMITLKPVRPRLLPQEIILDFAGENWPEPLFYGRVSPNWWYIEDVCLYPGGYNMAEILVTPVVGKNNKIELYQIRPIGLILSQKEQPKDNSVAVALNTAK